MFPGLMANSGRANPWPFPAPWRVRRERGIRAAGRYAFARAFPRAGSGWTGRSSGPAAGRCRPVSRAIREQRQPHQDRQAAGNGAQVQASRTGPESAAGQMCAAEVAAELPVRFSEASARWLRRHAICASLQPSRPRPMAIARQMYRPSRALSSSTGYGS